MKTIIALLLLTSTAYAAPKEDAAGPINWKDPTVFVALCKNHLGWKAPLSTLETHPAWVCAGSGGVESWRDGYKAMDGSLDREVKRVQLVVAPAKQLPVEPTAKAGIETATCRDGLTYYHPTGEHRGACSGHGGVASWTDGSPVKAHGRKGSYR